MGAKTITLPGERTKNGRAHTIPLSTDALAILRLFLSVTERDLVFGDAAGGFCWMVERQGASWMNAWVSL